MRYVARAVVGFVALVALSGSALAEDCTPVPPAEWNLHLDYVHSVHDSLAVDWFESHGCSWAGMDALNGSDGGVIDVGGHPGPAGLTLDQASVVSFRASAITGYFVDSACNRIAGSDYRIRTKDPIYAPAPFLVMIPTTAKWLVVANANLDDWPTGDMSVDKLLTVQSYGTDCPPPPPPPPSKKKRKKH